MTLPSLQWLMACSIQIAALVACGILLAKLFRLREPRLRWACFEVLLVLCLCLPFLQIQRRASAGGSVTRGPGPVESLQILSLGDSAPVAKVGAGFNLRLGILWLLGAGIVLRGGWLLIGLAALRRMRNLARPCSQFPNAAQEYLDRLGTGTQVLISDRVGGVLTFGVRSSVILVPSRFAEMCDETQAAVLLHELIHVRQRHWLLTVIEESVLTLVWFHPAVWWLVREIQLSREEAVDLEAVRVLESRSQYVDALMEVAEISGRVRISPATSFLWRGQLARRVTNLFTAGRTSRLRRALSLAGMAMGTVLVLRMGLLYFPARAVVHAQTAGAEPIVIENGGDHVLRRGGIEYPLWVQEERVEGLVNVEVSIDRMGRVLDARVLDGPQDLRRPVLRSVLDWQYDPQTKPAGTYDVAIRFTLPNPGSSSVIKLPEYTSEAELDTVKEERFLLFPQEQIPEALRITAVEAIKKTVENAEMAERGQLTGRITRIQPHGAAERMDLHLPVAVGDEVTPETVVRLQQSLRAVDPSLLLGLGAERDGSITVHIFSNPDRSSNGDRR
jgi:TonB family protein